ncbi:MAG: hypothetical protein LBB23_04645 [Rickettsiales bacterium]|jgi:hypothetical protein|nr:hypothetical protein [Rickettsiales bacterium]
MSDIKEILNKIPAELCGEWIRKNSGYESGLCAEIGWQVYTNRYYDATCDCLKIEIKKGRSIWLDLVRYSEILLGYGEIETITAFFIPSKNRKNIDDIYFVDTKDIMRKLNLSKDLAHQLLKLNHDVPRSLNVQANLTVNDIKKLAFHHKELRKIAL